MPKCPPVQKYDLFVLVVALMLASNLLQAAEPFDCSPGASSTAIDFAQPGTSSGGGLDCSILNQFTDTCLEGRQEFKIGRAIGNGLVQASSIGEIPVSDSNGFLLNSGQLIADGLVSRSVKMGFEFGTSGEEAGSVTVLLNGTAIASLPVRVGPVSRRCIDVGVQLFKFAHRVEGGKLQLGRNTLVFRLNRKNNGPPLVGEGASTIARATQLRFQALSPIMLAHGIGDNGDAFVSVPAALNGRIKPLIETFRSRRVGFAVVRYEPITIEDGGRILPGAIGQANQFGADEFHIVAWSKGGLWTRAAISATPSLACRTLFTLDTPHDGALGSAGDFLGKEKLRELIIGASARTRWGPLVLQMQDLYPAAVRKASAGWSTVPHKYPSSTGMRQSKYFSVAANADANADGIIQADEGDGFIGINFDDSNWVHRAWLRFLNYTAGGFSCGLRVDISGGDLFSRIVNLSPIQCGRVEPNDLIVRVASAGSPAFEPLGPSSATEFNFYYNHTSVLNDILGKRILSAIAANEPVAK